MQKQRTQRSKIEKDSLQRRKDYQNKRKNK